jgi:transposase
MLFLLSGGQANDAPFLRPLLESGRVGGRVRPRRVAADKAYSHPSLRAYLRRRGIGAVVPTKSNQRARPRFDGEAYRQRSLVERCVGRLKEHRRVATRYEKLAKSYLAMLHLAAILMWV